MEHVGDRDDDNDDFGADDVAVTMPDDDLEFIVVPNTSIADVHDNDADVDRSFHSTQPGDDQVDSTAPSSSLQRMAGKCWIQLATYNPLPALCRAIQDSHMPTKSDLVDRKQQLWMTTVGFSGPLASNNDALNPWDVAGLPPPLANAATLEYRSDLVVQDLSRPIQFAFRQSALRVLLLARCGSATAVLVSAAVLPFADWCKQSEATHSHLPHAMLASSAALYLLTLGVLYNVRHDTLINSAVATFLIGVEVCVALLACVMGHELAVGAAAALYIATMAGVYALVTWRIKLQDSGDFTLLHPVLAAAVSVTLVLGSATAVYCSSTLPALSPATMSSAMFASIITSVALAGLWTGLVLDCMSASLAPDEYARGVVLYHSDAVVACCVLPWRCCKRVWQGIVKRMRLAASIVRAADESIDADPSQPGIATGAADPVEAGAQPFKDRGEYRSPVAVVTPAGGGGASRRRSSIVEEV